MTPQEQQLIESLFQRLTQSAAQSGPRDPEAEALIQQRVQSLPGAAYYMAQTMLVQERALQQAEARLAGQQQGSFLPPGVAPGQAAYPSGGTPPYAAAPAGAYRQPGGGGGVGGFLAGAGKIALGIGGGILVADAAMGLAHGLFGQQGASAAYEQGFDQGARDDRQQDSGREDQTQQADSSQQQDYAQEDYVQEDDFDQQDDFDSSSDFDSGQDW
jgi:uncharacterized protein